MKKPEYETWLSDYKIFLESEDASVPNVMTRNVMARIEELLVPKAWKIFLKILGFQILAGFLSLSICHQFGMNPFGTSFSIADWMMAIGGHQVCMAGCGAIFLGAGFFASGIFLSREEAKVLRKTQILQSLGLATLSLAVFSFFGVELVIAVVGLWFLGALLGGVLAVEAVWQLKKLQIRSL